MSHPIQHYASRGGDDIIDDLKQDEVVTSALVSSGDETKLGIVQLFRIYWPGAMWSMLLSLALVMDGMDTGLVNNFFAQTAYVARFGITNDAGVRSIPAEWQSAINNAQQIGAIAGLAFVGWATDRFGSRKVYMLGMAMLIPAICILVFAVNLPMLMMGNMVCGVPWGIMQTLTTAYAAEICPTAMRGYLTTWVSMCWGFGNFLAAGILRSSLQVDGDWSWRMCYVLQWAWPVPLFIVGYLAPESPWYLVRQGKFEEAGKTLRRLARKGRYTDEEVREQIELIKFTDAEEKAASKSSSYFECFRGANRRRTEIACAAYAIQPLSGQGMTGYATSYLTAAGMATVQAFNFSMGIQSVNVVCTGIVIFLMGKVGRRTFYLFGIGAIALFQLLIGILGVVPGAQVALGIAIVMILIQASFKLSIGPVCYSIVGEVPSSRLRAKTVALSRASYIVTNIVISQILPRQLSATSWNWGAKSGFFWFGLGLICFTYTYFRIPETKGRPFVELDYLFQQGIPARKFKTTQVDLSAIHAASETVVDKPEAEHIEKAPISELK